MVIKQVSLKELRESKQENLKGLKPVRDEDINFSDIPELDLNDPLIWETVKMCPPCGKEKITIRLDSDVLNWFRSNGKYQTHINKVLRAYFETHLKNQK